MPDFDPERPVTAAQRAVDAPAERVLEDRFTDDPGGGGGGSAPAPLSLYPPKLSANFVENPVALSLRKALTRFASEKRFAGVQLAIVDMTSSRAAPVYAGVRDTDQVFIASMAKLALILPAFFLREAARRAAPTMTAKDSTDFFAKLKRDWAAQFNRFHRKGGDNDPPSLPRILTAKRSRPTDPFKIDFTDREDTDFDKLGFRQRLRLALRKSENRAAASCIRDLGFPYINGVHKEAGIHTTNGLRVALDFGGGYWDESQKHNVQAGTAASIAHLLTLLAQERLVEAQDPGMKSFLYQDIEDVMAVSVGSGPLTMGLHERLDAVGKLSLTRQGKVGFMDNTGPFCDAAIITRTSEAGTPLVYVGVALSGKSTEQIHEIGGLFDDCVLLAHGEKPKP